LLVNRVIDQDYSRHTVEHNLDFLSALGGNRSAPNTSSRFVFQPLTTPGLKSSWLSTG
jgi:hypothetical protein